MSSISRNSWNLEISRELSELWERMLRTTACQQKKSKMSNVSYTYNDFELFIIKWGFVDRCKGRCDILISNNKTEKLLLGSVLLGSWSVHSSPGLPEDAVLVQQQISSGSTAHFPIFRYKICFMLTLLWKRTWSLTNLISFLLILTF